MDKNLNYLIIHTDEHLTSWLGCMGNPRINTPNIDKLADEGRLFENAYTCNGVCTPSRASFLTGRYPIAHGVACNNQSLPATERTMGHVFSENGYRTGYFGKTHYGGLDDDMASDGWQESFIWKQQYNQYLKDKGINYSYPEGDSIDTKVRYWQIGTSNIPCEHYFENVIADEAIDFIRRNKTNPFLCFVGNIAPHNPFTPPEPYDTMYDPDDMVLEGSQEEPLQKKPHATVRWIRQNRKYLNEKELRIYLAHIYGLVSMIDDNVGKLINELKKEGVYKDTMVIFTSDHGDFGTRYGILGKSWSMADELLKVPLIISHPEIRDDGGRTTSLTSNVDILPTLMDYSNIEIPPKVQGKSIRSIIEDESNKVNDCVYGYDQFRNSSDHLYMSMIRQDSWKYVHSDNGYGELYDLENDTREMDNLIDEEDFLELVIDLRQQLLEWHIENSGGYYNVEEGDYWEDAVDFYDEEKFDGRRHR